MKTGAAYIRVSTDEQTEYSPDSQLRIIMDYAHREGITIPKEYIFSDEGISGRSASKRPGFMRMISLAKSHAFDVILVYSLSRFARSREDSIVYKKMLRHECGVDVISVSQNIGSDKTSILMEAILEAMDEYYSIDLSENVRRGMLEKASRGEAMGRAPFGYKICGRIFVPDENTAPIVRMIFSDYISGMGVRTIAEKLNLMGIRTSSGRQFENRTVSYILKNEVYRGVLKWRSGEDDVKVENAHEAIITDEIFFKAKERLSHTSSLYAPHEKKAPSNMLSGLIKCSSCGKSLVKQTISKRTYMQCGGYVKGTCRVSHAVKYDLICSRITSRIIHDIEDFPVSIKKIHTDSLVPEDSLLMRQEEKLDRVREAYENGVYTLDEYKKSKERIQNIIKELRSNIDKSKTRTSEILPQTTSFHTLIGDTSPLSCKEKNLLFRIIISHIIYDKKSDTLSIFYR